MPPVLTSHARRTTDVAIGKRLKHFLAVRSVSYADLADALDVTEKRVARIINGTSAMSAADLIWTAKVLDIDVADLCPR